MAIARVRPGGATRRRRRRRARRRAASARDAAGVGAVDCARQAQRARRGRDRGRRLRASRGGGGRRRRATKRRLRRSKPTWLRPPRPSRPSRRPGAALDGCSRARRALAVAQVVDAQLLRVERAPTARGENARQRSSAVASAPASCSSTSRVWRRRRQRGARIRHFGLLPAITPSIVHGCPRCCGPARPCGERAREPLRSPRKRVAESARSRRPVGDRRRELG